MRKRDDEHIHELVQFRIQSEKFQHAHIEKNLSEDIREKLNRLIDPNRRSNEPERSQSITSRATYALRSLE